MNRLLIACFCLLFFGVSCTSNTDKGVEYEEVSLQIPNPVTILYDIIDTLPHDTHAFTEGFVFYKGKLYESTGQYGETTIRIINPANGQIIEKVNHPDKKIFGEGIAHFQNKWYQLTYQSHRVFVYGENNFHKKIGEFSWPKEGWGLTHNAKSLLLSDGSAEIHYINPENFKSTKSLKIEDHKGAVDEINELEFIEGFIFANRWHHDQILKIDPATGYVVGKLHMEGVLEQYARSFRKGPEDVLNGIAWTQKIRLCTLRGKIGH